MKYIYQYGESTPDNDDNDDIDLKDLFLMLWYGKRIILSSMLIFSVISGAYAYSQQSWWTSKAIVTVPNINQIAPFIQVTKRYQNAFSENGGTNKLDQLNNLIVIFNRFIQLFNSNDNKKLFLSSNSLFSEMKRELNPSGKHDDYEERFFLKEWFSRIEAIKIKESNKYMLSVQSIAEKSSLVLLSDYINFTNENIKNDLIVDFLSEIEINKKQLEQELQSRILLATKNLELDIIRAEYALKIANAAKIEKPLENWNENETFPISLGSDGIEAKIKILKSVDNLWVIDPQFSAISTKLMLLDTTPTVINKIQAFNFLELPDIALNHDASNRILIVVLGLFFGGLLGTGILFLKKTIK